MTYPMRRELPRKLIPILLVLLFASSRVTSAKTSEQSAVPAALYAVKLTDDGASSTPLIASGRILFHEELFQDAVQFHYEVDIAYTNITTKDIRAYEVEIDATPERGGGFAYIDRKDFFFKPQDVFAPAPSEHGS